LIALLFPFLVEILIIGIAVRAGWQSLSPEFVSYRNGTVIVGDKLGLLFREQRQKIGYFTLNLTLSMVVGAIYYAFFTFGQEFGWRGYLQGQAIEALGVARGLMVVGITWGVWYLPLILMGYRFPNNRRLGGFLLMPLGTIALSVVAGWLYQAANTIWAPTFFHAAILVSADLSLKGLGDQGRDLRIRILWIVIWLLFAILGTFPQAT
jgi:membrane protease YdiL (CAAX protease family)